MNKLYVKTPRGEKYKIMNGIVIGFAERIPEIAAIRNMPYWRIECNAIRSKKLSNVTVDDLVVALEVLNKLRTSTSHFWVSQINQKEELVKLAFNVEDGEYIAYEHFICIWGENGIPKAITGGLFVEPVYMDALIQYLINSINRLDKEKLPQNIFVPSKVNLPLPMTQKLYFHCQNIANGTCAVHLHNREQLEVLATYLNNVHKLTVDPSDISDAEIEVFEKFCIRDGQFVRASKADWDTFVDARELMRLIDHVNQGIGRGLLG